MRRFTAAECKLERRWQEADLVMKDKIMAMLECLTSQAGRRLVWKYNRRLMGLSVDYVCLDEFTMDVPL